MQKEGLRELFAELKITTSGSLKWDRRLGYIMILIGGGVLLLDPASLSSWLLVLVGLWVCLRPLWLPSLYDDLVLKSAGEETLDKHLLIGGYLAAYSILLITIGAVGLAVGGFGAGLFSFGIIGASLKIILLAMILKCRTYYDYVQKNYKYFKEKKFFSFRGKSY